MWPVLVGSKVAYDKAEDVGRCTETFNKYLKLECAPENWAQGSIDVHGILPTDARITGAEKEYQRSGQALCQKVI